MPTYTCPECKTQLKRKEPVEAGKKLRCPECQAVFAVKGEKKAAPAPTPVASNVGKWDDEEDGPANYALITEATDKASEERRQQAFSVLADRFERSKRGPALELVVKPSNCLLLCGVLTCCMAIGGAFWSVFPMIFKVEKVNAEKKSMYGTQSNKKEYEKISDDELRTRWWCLAGFIAFFAWGAVVSAGASKMHMIEMYWLAWVGAVMALLGPFVPLAIWLYLQGNYDDKGNPLSEPDMAFVGPSIIAFFVPGVPVSVWNMSVLSKKLVKEGFYEEPPE